MFECRLHNQAATDFGSCSDPTTYTGLGDGSHRFEVRAVDLAGHIDPTPANYSWTIDTTEPETTIDSGPLGTTNDATPTFTFSSEPGASFQCRVDNSVVAACASPHTAPLNDGAHAFEVRASDGAGNQDRSPAERTFTVDTLAPQTTITSAPPTATSSTGASFGFSSSESSSTFDCSLDGAAWIVCTSPHMYTGLTAGSHQFSVRARDIAGNLDATPATHRWTITASQGCGSAVTAVADADAWIDENSPANNKGSDSVLKVQSKGPWDNFRALVRFRLPDVPQGCVVKSATLRLYAASVKSGRTLHAIGVASAWSESQVNWANQPQATGEVAATASGSNPGYREWNVSSQVQTMYVGPNHGFLIRDAVEGNDAEQQFHSREKGETPPQLVITFG